MYTIYLDKDFTGEYLGVIFVEGTGKTKDPVKAAKFRRKGFSVNKDPEPVLPEDTEETDIETVPHEETGETEIETVSESPSPDEKPKRGRSKPSEVKEE